MEGGVSPKRPPVGVVDGDGRGEGDQVGEVERPEQAEAEQGRDAGVGRRPVDQAVEGVHQRGRGQGAHADGPEGCGD